MVGLGSTLDTFDELFKHSYSGYETNSRQITHLNSNMDNGLLSNRDEQEALVTSIYGYANRLAQLQREDPTLTLHSFDHRVSCRPVTTRVFETDELGICCSYTENRRCRWEILSEKIYFESVEDIDISSLESTASNRLSPWCGCNREEGCICDFLID